VFKFTVENSNGEKLKLTACKEFDVIEVDGLSPNDATLNTSERAGIDGDTLNGSRIGKRNIVIYLNIKAPVESNRQVLYKFFNPKQKCRLYFENGVKSVYIDGFVEKHENNFFTIRQKPQISIICLDPYFKNVKEHTIEFSSVTKPFKFPFSISADGVEFGKIERKIEQTVNAGEVETGAIFRASISGNVSNITVFNRTTQQFFKLNNLSLVASDEIIIDTIKNEKSAFLLRNGVLSNLLSYRDTESSWLQLAPGANLISFSADVGTEYINLSVEINHKYVGL